MTSKNATTIGGLPALVYGDPTTSKSVCPIFHGDGEKGPDVSLLISNLEFVQKFEAGQLPANRLIVMPVLPKSQSGWWENTTVPVMQDIVAKFGLLIDDSGYSLGGIAVGDDVPNKIIQPLLRSACTVCGKVDQAGQPNTYPAFRKIPSIHFYDTNDTQVNYGYQNISAMVTQLQSEGKKDISLVKLKGSPTPHNIWNQVYEGLYWQWIDSLDAGIPAPDPIVSSYYDGLGNIINVTLSGKKIPVRTS